MSKQSENLQSKTNVQLLMKAETEAAEIVKDAKKSKLISSHLHRKSSKTKKSRR
jgi:hypothetical protein